MTLQNAREALGWTPRKLDKAAGVPIGTTYDIESGRNKNPSWGIVSSLTAALQKAGLKGVTSDVLFPRDSHAAR